MNLLSLTAKQFNEAINAFSKGKLNYSEDLERLIEISFRFDNLRELEELAFHAKYLNGLIKIIRNKDNSPEADYFLNIEKEYAEHIEKVRAQFQLLIEPAPAFIKEIFTGKYLEMTVESMECLNKLCDDLSKVKSYLNELKESGKGF